MNRDRFSISECGCQCDSGFVVFPCPRHDSSRPVRASWSERHPVADATLGVLGLSLGFCAWLVYVACGG